MHHGGNITITTIQKFANKNNFLFYLRKKFEQNISQERNQHNTHLATGGRIKLNHHQPHGATFKLTSN